MMRPVAASAASGSVVVVAPPHAATKSARRNPRMAGRAYRFRAARRRADLDDLRRRGAAAAHGTVPVRPRGPLSDAWGTVRRTMPKRPPRLRAEIDVPDDLAALRAPA